MTKIEDYRKKLATKIHAERHYKRLSQSDLAKKAGVSRPIISQIENANIDSVKFNTIQKVCNALNITIKMVFN